MEGGREEWGGEVGYEVMWWVWVVSLCMCTFTSDVCKKDVKHTVPKGQLGAETKEDIDRTTSHVSFAVRHGRLGKECPRERQMTVGNCQKRRCPCFICGCGSFLPTSEPTYRRVELRIGRPATAYPRFKRNRTHEQVHGFLTFFQSCIKPSVLKLYPLHTHKLTYPSYSSSSPTSSPSHHSPPLHRHPSPPPHPPPQHPPPTMPPSPSPHLSSSTPP